MQRIAATLLLLLVVRPALAADRGPVCRQPSVLDEMTREVRATNYYGTVDPRLVTEQPTAAPMVVRCDVCVLYQPYETARFGDRPIARCLPRGFEVQILPDGFVVSALR